MAYEPECYSEIEKIMRCGSRDIDYTVCCQFYDVPLDCITLCNPIVDIRKKRSENDSQNIFSKCATYVNIAAKCFHKQPCNTELIGDRYCDDENNFEHCNNYDGGDCKQPNTKEWSDCPHNPKLIGDGKCDLHLVAAECNFDGTDCCDISLINNRVCDDTNNYEACGNSDGEDCGPFSNTNWPECKHNPKYVGDGICDYHLLTTECNFDSGDCCYELSPPSVLTCCQLHSLPELHGFKNNSAAHIKAVSKCFLELGNWKPQASKKECGLGLFNQRTARIVGGTSTRFGDYPFMALLGMIILLFVITYLTVLETTECVCTKGV